MNNATTAAQQHCARCGREVSGGTWLDGTGPFCVFCVSATSTGGGVPLAVNCAVWSLPITAGASLELRPPGVERPSLTPDERAEARRFCEKARNHAEAFGMAAAMLAEAGGRGVFSTAEGYAAMAATHAEAALLVENLLRLLREDGDG